MNWSKLPTFVSVSIVVAFAACIVACSGTTTSSVSGNGQDAGQDTFKQNSPTEHKIDAIIEAQKCVKRFLKYPHDAKFPWSGGSATGNDTDGYWVTGKVKAKNAFGAELTHEWMLNLTIQNSTWHLVYCQIAGEVVYVDEDTTKALERVAATGDTEAISGETFGQVHREANQANSASWATWPTESQKVAKTETKPVPAMVADDNEAAPALPEKLSTFRTWTDDTGAHTIEAEFAGYIAGTVKLRKRDGKEVEMPMERLSEEDQAWIRERGK